MSPKCLECGDSFGSLDHCPNACRNGAVGGRVRRRLCHLCGRVPEDQARWGLLAGLCRPCALSFDLGDGDCEFCGVPDCKNGCHDPDRYGCPAYGITGGAREEGIECACGYCRLPLTLSVDHTDCPVEEQRPPAERTFVAEKRLLDRLDDTGELPALSFNQRRALEQEGLGIYTLRRKATKVMRRHRIDQYVTQKHTVVNRVFTKAAMELLQRACFQVMCGMCSEVQRICSKRVRSVAPVAEMEMVYSPGRYEDAEGAADLPMSMLDTCSPIQKPATPAAAPKAKRKRVPSDASALRSVSPAGPTAESSSARAPMMPEDARSK